MRVTRLSSVLAALALTLAAWPAAALTLTFKVDITSANGGDGAPFSFLQTWTLDETSPDGGAASPGSAAMPDALKATAAFPASDYASAWTLGDEIGEMREPGLGGFRLFDTADPPGPFSYAFRITGLGVALDPSASLYDRLVAYNAGRAFQVVLTGPAVSDVGDFRTPGSLTQREYRGVANLVFAAPAPEPASWLLLISGFAVAGGALRRRRAVPAPATN